MELSLGMHDVCLLLHGWEFSDTNGDAMTLYHIRCDFIRSNLVLGGHQDGEMSLYIADS